MTSMPCRIILCGQDGMRQGCRVQPALTLHSLSGPEKDGHWVCRRVVRLLMGVEEYCAPPQLEGYEPVA